MTDFEDFDEAEDAAAMARLQAERADYEAQVDADEAWQREVAEMQAAEDARWAAMDDEDA